MEAIKDIAFENHATVGLSKACSGTMAVPKDST